MVDLVALRENARRQVQEAERVSHLLDAIAAFQEEAEALGAVFEVKQTGASQFRLDLGFAVSPAPAAPDAAAPDFEIDKLVDVAREVFGAVDAPAPVPAAPAAAAQPKAGPWTDAELARAHKMLDAGATGGAIAKALGRGANAVSVKVAKLRAQRGDAKWRAARAGEAVAPVPPPTAPAKRKLVPGKDRVAKAAPAPAVAKPAASPAVPFAQRAGVASLPPRAAPDVPASGAQGERPYAERQIIAHLHNVGYCEGWNAERDLELVEEICRGASLGVVATKLQIAVGAAQDRWKQLNTHIGDLDHQTRLVRILKERANA